MYGTNPVHPPPPLPMPFQPTNDLTTQPVDPTPAPLSAQRKRHKDKEGEAISLHSKAPAQETLTTTDPLPPTAPPIQSLDSRINEATQAASRKRPTSAGSLMSDKAGKGHPSAEDLEQDERRKQAEHEKKKRDREAARAKRDKEVKDVREKATRDQREAEERSQNAPPPPKPPAHDLPPPNSPSRDQEDEEPNSFDRCTPPPTPETKKNERNQAIMQGVQDSDRIRSQDTNSLPIAYPNEEGFPLIYGPHANFHIDNLKRSQLRDWLSAPGAGVLIHIMFQNSWDPERVPTLVNLVRGLITEHFDIDDFHVSPGLPEADPKRTAFAPYAFAILNLPEDVADKLVDQRCLANKKIAFIIYPFDYIAPTAFLGTIQGLVGLQVPGSVKLLTRTFKGFWRKNEVWNILLDYVYSTRNPGPGGPADDVSMENDDESKDDTKAETLLDLFTLYRVEAKGQGSVDQSSLNIYLDLAHPSPQLWKALNDAISRTKYDTSFNGCGRYNPGWACVQCRGVDHPAGLCPYHTDVPDWMDICGLTINTVDDWEVKTFPNITRRAYGPQSRGGAQGRGIRGGCGGPSGNNDRGAHGGRGGNGGRDMTRRGPRGARASYSFRG